MDEVNAWKGFVEEWLLKTGSQSPFSRQPLAGDASNRQYFRICFDSHERSSAILMQKNKGEGFKRSEEAVSGKGPPGDPFILIDRFLKGNGLPVPDLLHVEEDGSMVLQEDFGDHTLFTHLLSHPGDEEALTRKVILLLINLQKLNISEEMQWMEERCFSEGLIRWEFEHFLEFGLMTTDEGLLSSIRNLVAQESEALSRTDDPVLVHRDFHSRNIMVRENGTLGLIDFQDLLLGSPFYDLASFLFDPYRYISMADIEMWSRFYYREALDAGVLPKHTQWKDCFLLLSRHAFQRNLKACGRFFYIAEVKGNPSFLSSVAGTHRNMARLAENIPVLRPLYEKIHGALKAVDHF